MWLGARLTEATVSSKNIHAFLDFIKQQVNISVSFIGILFD